MRLTRTRGRRAGPALDVRQTTTFSSAHRVVLLGELCGGRAAVLAKVGQDVVDLGAEQQGDVRKPQPGQKNDAAAERAVGRRVAIEVRQVDAEAVADAQPQ